ANSRFPVTIGCDSSTAFHFPSGAPISAHPAPPRLTSLSCACHKRSSTTVIHERLHQETYSCVCINTVTYFSDFHICAMNIFGALQLHILPAATTPTKASCSNLDIFLPARRYHSLKNKQHSLYRAVIFNSGVWHSHDGS